MDIDELHEVLRRNLLGTIYCIAPGYIGTGRLLERFEQAGVDEIVSRVALRGLGIVEDRARVVEFLATDLSDYVTGAVAPIDGGSTRWPS